MAECPRCFETLADPNACRCGWKARVRTKDSDKPKHERVPCAFMMCDEEAKVRQRMPTGWANLCLTHYEAHHAEQAAKRITALGLDRQPGEARELHHKRLMGYMREKLRTGRMFAGMEAGALAEALEDEWSRTA